MYIDCGTCTGRGSACADCVVTHLLAMPDVHEPLPLGEERALAALHEAGLVPPLRMVPVAPTGRAVGQ